MHCLLVYHTYPSPDTERVEPVLPRTSSGKGKKKKKRKRGLHNFLLSVRPSYQAPLPSPPRNNSYFSFFPLSSGLCILSYDDLLDSFLVSWVPVQGGTEREHLVRPSVSPVHDTEFFSSPSPSPRTLSERSGSPSSTRGSPLRTRCDATSRGPPRRGPFFLPYFALAEVVRHPGIKPSGTLVRSHPTPRTPRYLPEERFAGRWRGNLDRAETTTTLKTLSPTLCFDSLTAGKR